MSNSLRPYGLQHRHPCTSLSPGVCSNSCALNQWAHPTIISSVAPFSSCLQPFPGIRVFCSESAVCIRWPKYWSFSFSISPSNEYAGLISFRIDWFDLAVQGTLKSLLQHHSLKASIVWHSAFVIVQLSYPYMTTEETFDYMDLFNIGPRQIKLGREIWWDRKLIMYYKPIILNFWIIHNFNSGTNKEDNCTNVIWFYFIYILW